MSVSVYRVQHEPVIAGPGLSTDHYRLQLPALERLQDAFGRTGTGPALYGWMDDERACFGVREGFGIWDVTLGENHASAFLNYDASRIGDAVNLKDMPKNSFDADGMVSREGIRNLLTPLKERVSISANVHAGGTSSDYSLVYSFSDGTPAENPFFIYVGCLDGKGHDYRKTLRTISPGYSGLLDASSAEDLLQHDLSFEDFMNEFVFGLIPSIKSGLTARTKQKA